MNKDCPAAHRLVELLDHAPSDPKMEAHVLGCRECYAQVVALRRSWSAMGPTGAPSPSPAVRQRVMEHARSRLREGEVPGRWGIMPAVRWPIAIAVAAAVALAVLAGMRSGLQPGEQGYLGAPGLVVAVGLAASLWAILRSAAPGVMRVILGGGLVGLGGYALLVLTLPVADTVHFCGRLVFGSLPLSLGELCAVYLGISALYAGLPMAAVGYAGDPRAVDSGVGLREAVVFALLGAPTVLLQAGADPVAVSVVALIGFVTGSLLGVTSGQRARRWVVAAEPV